MQTSCNKFTIVTIAIPLLKSPDPNQPWARRSVFTPGPRQLGSKADANPYHYGLQMALHPALLYLQ